MKNAIDRLKSAFSGYDFFSEKYLCDQEVATQRFYSALNEASQYYTENKHTRVNPDLIHESWQHYVSAMETYFPSQMNEDFMLNEVINSTMVFTNRKAHKLELKNLSAAFDKKMTAEIISKNVNASFLSGKSRKATLINSAHHLHHLMRFEQRTGRKIGGIESVVDFGGGYGNMARVVDNFGSCKAYTIVDLLLFSCIQYVFLSTVAGNDQVTFDGANAKQNAKFILHPLFSADSPTSLHGELFLSTWALSEGTHATFEWVTAHDWFGATNLLLAYNENVRAWHENELEESLASKEWRIEKEAIPFLPGSFYLFATR